MGRFSFLVAGSEPSAWLMRNKTVICKSSIVMKKILHGAVLLLMAGLSVQSVHAETQAHYQIIKTEVTPTFNLVGNQVLTDVVVENTGQRLSFELLWQVYDSHNSVTSYGGSLHGSVPGSLVFGTTTVAFKTRWTPTQPGPYRIVYRVFEFGHMSMVEGAPLAEATVSLNVVDPATLTTTPSFQYSTTTVKVVPLSENTRDVFASIKNEGGPGKALIDLEAYNVFGEKVAQSFFDNEFFDPNQTRDFLQGLQLSMTGARKISVGIFKPGWSELLSWHDGVAYLEEYANAAYATTPVYRDSLALGWEDWSWNVSRTFDDMSAADGTRAIRIEYNAPWAGLYLYNAINTRGALALAFSVSGDAATLKKIRLYAYDLAGKQLPAVNLDEYMIASGGGATWSAVRIPLGQILTSNTIQGFVLQDISGVSGGVIRVKNIRFE